VGGLRARRCAAVVSATLLATAVVTPIPAALAYDKHECLVASDDGQALRLDGKLLRARERLLVCADPSCPSLVRAACADWAGALDQQIPSVVFAVSEADGRDAVGVTVFEGGVPRPEAGGGRALQLDPGRHSFRLVAPDGRTVQVVVVAVEGDQRRRVVAVLPPPPKPSRPVPPPLPPPSWPAWTAGIVAGAGWASFGVLAASGHADYEHLKETCAPGCDAGQYPTAKFVAADVSLGLAVVATTLAVYLVLQRGSASVAGTAQAWVPLTF
jgi:hypothetical protein